jgi:ABC-type uncharacterized transport system permease subunit
VKGVIDRIEIIHNQLSDSNWVWFPFLFLKPKASEKINQKRKFLMSICFGFYFTAALVIRNVLFSRPTDIESLPTLALSSVLGFFFWFTLVTAYFWNRRAKRLQKGMIR